MCLLLEATVWSTFSFRNSRAMNLYYHKIISENNILFILKDNNYKNNNKNLTITAGCIHARKKIFKIIDA